MWQILMRDEAHIAEAKKELDGGASFEAVAKKQFPTIPEGQRPWDLPNLRWKQMPAAWRGAVERMKPGETSDVIRGEAGRFWIIKLIERSDDAAATFEQEKAAIVEDLRLKKIEELRTKTAEDLRNAARIEYTSK